MCHNNEEILYLFKMYKAINISYWIINLMKVSRRSKNAIYPYHLLIRARYMSFNEPIRA